VLRSRKAKGVRPTSLGGGWRESCFTRGLRIVKEGLLFFASPPGSKTRALPTHCDEQKAAPLAAIVPAHRHCHHRRFFAALRLVQLALQPRHQVFSVLQPRLLLALADVSLGDALLYGLMLPAAMIRLLLHGATVRYFSLQGSLTGLQQINPTARVSL
jgi:hypothetical protein